MVIDDFPGDKEAETGPALALLGREVGVENPRNLLWTDALAGIGNAHINIEIPANAADFNPALAAARGLDRVDDDVLNRSGNLYGVAHQRAWIFGHVALQFDRCFFGHGADAGNHLAHDVRN